MATCRECGCTEITPCLTPVEGAAGWQPCGWFVGAPAMTSLQPEPDVEPLCTACAPDAPPALTYAEWTGAMRRALAVKVAQPSEGRRPLDIRSMAIHECGGIVSVDPETPTGMWCDSCAREVTKASVGVVYRCAACGWARTCGDPPGEDCHS